MAAAAPAAAAPASKWEPLQRDYAAERRVLEVKLEPASAFHPLMGRQQLIDAERKEKAAKAGDEKAGDVKAEAAAAAAVRTQTPVKDEKAKAPKPDFDDPLRMLGGGGGGGGAASPAAPKKPVDDPLRMGDSKAAGAASPTAAGGVRNFSAAAASLLAPTPGSKADANMSDSKRVANKARRKGAFEMWPEKRGRILKKYTTNQKVAVTADFLDDAEEKKAVVAVEQTQQRLATLESENAEASKSYLTQKEYIAHIEEQHQKLRSAWDADQRVLALKIAIQCAKLLGDTSVPAFYPSMFVLLSEILDTFGELVFDRIKRRGVEIVSAGNQITTAALPANFKSTDVCASAKETCRNWFYKTACIRELLPRLYIDLALIKSYRFLEDGTYPQILDRLSRTIRGIGDPLVATYARAYLTTKAVAVSDSFLEDNMLLGDPVLPAAHQRTLIEAFDDFQYSYKQLKAAEFGNVSHIKSGKVDLDAYIDLYSPALEWMLQCVGLKSSAELFFALLQQWRDYCNNSAVLVHLLGSFAPAFVSNHALHMTNLIKECDENAHVKKSKLYLTLGKALVSHAPPKDQRLPILNDIWKVVSKIVDPEEYIEIAEVFVQYLLQNFSDREVNIFLKDVIKHVRESQAYKRLQSQLASIVSKIIVHNNDLDKTLAMDNFLPILDLLDKQAKVPAGKVILGHFAKTKGSTSDPVIIHTLFDVAKSLHDSVDSMSFDDERRQISHLIVKFVRKVDFGRDLEAQLNMFVDFRHAFTNLDAVTREMVMRVALLATKAHSFMKGKHTKKTAAFVKACLAYCHITIPSLDDIIAKLYLMLQCGQVALVNGMIVQSEGFLKSAISLIPDVPHIVEVNNTRKSTEEDLVSFLRNFASFLLLFPGHPKNGPFYLIQGLLNAIQQYAPWKSVTPHKTQVFIGMLQLFCTYAQRTFPYHIAGVESNDMLYGGGDAEYIAAVKNFIDQLIGEVARQIQEIGEKKDILSRKQYGTLALDTLNVLISSMAMNNQSATLVVKLYQLAKSSDAVDPKYMANTLEHLAAKKGTWYQDILSKIRAVV